MKNVMSLVNRLSDMHGVDYVQLMTTEAKSDRDAIKKLHRSSVFLTEEATTELLSQYDRLGILILELEDLKVNAQSDMQFSVEDDGGELVSHSLDIWDFLVELDKWK